MAGLLPAVVIIVAVLLVFIVAAVFAQAVARAAWSRQFDRELDLLYGGDTSTDVCQALSLELIVRDNSVHGVHGIT